MKELIENQTVVECSNGNIGIFRQQMSNQVQVELVLGDTSLQWVDTRTITVVNDSSATSILGTLHRLKTQRKRETSPSDETIIFGRSKDICDIVKNKLQGQVTDEVQRELWNHTEYATLEFRDNKYRCLSLWSNRLAMIEGITDFFSSTELIPVNQVTDAIMQALTPPPPRCTCTRLEAIRILSKTVASGVTGGFWIPSIPSDVGLEVREDRIHFEYCLDCGKIQSKEFPIAT